MEMTYYTGIDVSLRSVSICVVDDKGEVCLRPRLRPRSMPSPIACAASAAT
jgi:predicted NBD/HSP70 family sugar kinase